ncbi:MAG: stage III sporulation protein AC [Clostridia bacterium]|mgnify:FL=1|nr:stage III sporulation protein AC [Clostridia bacterium]
MDVTLILKVIGIGFIVAVSAQILGKTGRDEQVTFVIIAGIVAVIALLVGEISTLFTTIGELFGF